MAAPAEELTNAELVGRLRRYDEQLNALLLNIERDAAVPADRNLSTSNQNTPPMTLNELSNVLIPHFTVNRSATMVANNIMLDYGALEAEQKAQFTALFRRWSARSFDWALRCEPTVLAKIAFVIILAQYRNHNGCRVSSRHEQRRPMLYWKVAGGRSSSTCPAARLLCAIIHGWSAICGMEASHRCHTNACLHEEHVLPESVALNAMRERCRKGWDVCRHVKRCMNCAPLMSGTAADAANGEDDDEQGDDPFDDDDDDDDDNDRRGNDDDDDIAGDGSKTIKLAEVVFNRTTVTLGEHTFRYARLSGMLVQLRCSREKTHSNDGTNKCSATACYMPLLKVFRTKHHGACALPTPTRNLPKNTKCLKTRLEEATRKAQQSLVDGKDAAQKKASKPATRKRARAEKPSQDEVSKPPTSKRLHARIDEEPSDAEASQEE